MEDPRDARAQRKDRVWMQREEGFLQAEEKSLCRNQPCRLLDLGLPASRLRGNKFLLFKPSLWHLVVAAQAEDDQGILQEIRTLVRWRGKEVQIKMMVDGTVRTRGASRQADTSW